MARDDQQKRRMKGPTGLPGEPNGTHIVAYPGRKATCNCGGCRNGERIQQEPKVRVLK